MKNPIAVWLTVLVLIVIGIHTYLSPATSATGAAGDGGQNIGLMNGGDLLTLIVALSAYIATIRLVVIGRLSQLRDQAAAATDATQWTKLSDRRSVLRAFLLTLLPAEAPLVVAGVWLTLHLFGNGPEWATNRVSVLFCWAIMILALHHLVAWFLSVTNAATAKEVMPRFAPAETTGTSTKQPDPAPAAPSTP